MRSNYGQINTSNAKKNVFEPALVRPYSKKELRILYDLPEKSFSAWLLSFQKEIGKRRGRFYTPLQVRIIFSKLGEPNVLNEDL